MQDTRLHHNGQPVAYVVAETLEQARKPRAWCASTTAPNRPSCGSTTHSTRCTCRRRSSTSPTRSSGATPPPAFEQAEVRVEQDYASPTHHHNPIEPHATTAVVGRQLADAVRDHPGRAPHPRCRVGRVRPAAVGGPGHRPLSRRGFRHQGDLGAHPAHRRGGQTRWQAGEARADPRPDVHLAPATAASSATTCGSAPPGGTLTAIINTSTAQLSRTERGGLQQQRRP